MSGNSDAHDLIGPMLTRFQALGLSDIAGRLRAIAEAMVVQKEGAKPGPFPPVPADVSPEDLLSLQAASAVLELRSPSTVRILARGGTLEGFCQAGGEVVVTRRSVEAYLESPQLPGQRLLEAQLWSVLAEQD